MQDKLSELTLVLIASSVIILLLAFVVVFSLFTNQKRKFRHRQQLENQKKEFDEEILRTQLEIQTQTFESISRELHDNVSNTLSVALLNLNLIGNGNNNEANSRLEETKSLLLEAKSSVKDFSWYINPENIHTITLGQSLQDLVERIVKLKLFQINFTVNGEAFTFESSKEIIIYRIVQEALNNIVKHSNGNSVDVNLLFSFPNFKITIRDEGPGFDINQKLGSSAETHGSGLKNMMSRARMINAQLSIDSSPGNGTTIHLDYQMAGQLKTDYIN